MRLPLGQRPLGANRGRVRPNRHEGRRQPRAHVVVAHHVEERARAPLGADDDVKEHVPRVGLASRRNLAEALPHHGLVVLGGHRRNLDALEGRGHQQVLPAVGRGLDLFPDARPLRRIGQAREHRVGAPFLRPQRQHGRQARAARRVGIHRGGDLLARGRGRRQLPKRLAHAAPIGACAHLQMEDDHRKVAVLANAQRLVERVEEVEALAADMRHVEPALLACDLGERNEFIGRGKRARHVDECARESERAVVHGARHHLLHARQLVGGRRPVVQADDLAAHERRRNERAQVDGDTAGRESGEVLVEGGPVHRQAGARERFGARGLGRPERRGVALADDLAGDALAQMTLAVAVNQERCARLALNVDEAGADDASGGVDHGRGRRRGEIAEGHDAVAAYAHVGPEPWRAAAVDELPAAHDHVEPWRRRSTRGQPDRRQPCEPPSVPHQRHLLWFTSVQAPWLAILAGTSTAHAHHVSFRDPPP